MAGERSPLQEVGQRPRDPGSDEEFWKITGLAKPGHDRGCEHGVCETKQICSDAHPSCLGRLQRDTKVATHRVVSG